MVEAVRLTGTPLPPMLIAPPPIMLPAKVIPDWVRAVNPPVAVNVSVLESPICHVPVLANVIALVIVVLDPVKDKL